MKFIPLLLALCLPSFGDDYLFHPKARNPIALYLSEGPYSTNRTSTQMAGEIPDGMPVWRWHDSATANWGECDNSTRRPTWRVGHTYGTGLYFDGGDYFNLSNYPASTLANLGDWTVYAVFARTNDATFSVVDASLFNLNPKPLLSLRASNSFSMTLNSTVYGGVAASAYTCNGTNPTCLVLQRYSSGFRAPGFRAFLNGHMILWRTNADATFTSSGNGLIGNLRGSVMELGAFGESGMGLARQIMDYSARKFSVYEGAFRRQREDDQFVYLIGNSLTFGTGAETVSNVYPYQLTTMLGLNNWRMANFGYAGSTQTNLFAFNGDAITYTRSFIGTSGRRRVAVVWEGRNNMWYSADKANTNETFQMITNFGGLLKGDGFRVYVGTVLPSGNDATFNASRNCLNAMIRAGGAGYDGVADFAADSHIGDDGDELDTTYYAADQVHLKAAGYTIIATIVSNVLSTISW